MLASCRQAIALLLMILALGLVGCGDSSSSPAVLLEGYETEPATNPLIGTMAEVSPPERIQQLKPFLDVYEPSVHITSPKENAVIQDTTVSVELQVRDLPIYKDADLGLGPHLHVFLDDRPYRAAYTTDDPIVFTDLAPGTHTLRVFASRPWHESFKNEGAYDQVTFNVFAESPQNTPDDSQVLLTYSRPQGAYGAEPILLDFYLTNAPPHIVAATDDRIADWRIRCTINGESFTFDRWQPIYLKGFQPGNNWVKLELIDDQDRLIDNAFNTGLRVITYTPNGDDSLSQLMRDEIPLSLARVLVDPTYTPPVPAPEEVNEPVTPDTIETETTDAEGADAEAAKAETIGEDQDTDISDTTEDAVESAATDQPQDQTLPDAAPPLLEDTSTPTDSSVETDTQTPEPVPSAPVKETLQDIPVPTNPDQETHQETDQASGDDLEKQPDSNQPDSLVDRQAQGESDVPAEATSSAAPMDSGTTTIPPIQEPEVVSPSPETPASSAVVPPDVTDAPEDAAMGKDLGPEGELEPQALPVDDRVQSSDASSDSRESSDASDDAAPSPAATADESEDAKERSADTTAPSPDSLEMLESPSDII